MKTTTKFKLLNYLFVLFASLLYVECSGPSLIKRTENKQTPQYFSTSQDTLSSAKIRWRDYFSDNDLSALIDTALSKNQELNILLQEINIAKNEVRARKGAYLPFVGLGIGAGTDKTGLYTSKGVSDEAHEIIPGNKTPNPLSDFMVKLNTNWEVDIWKKLRNSKKSAIHSYLSTIEGKNFMVTNLIAEIANSYYELLALDNQLEILNKNIEIQKNALEIIKFEKQSARVTELAVKKFEAEVFKNQSQQFYIKQKITETENKLNFLAGRFPQPIKRKSSDFMLISIDSIHSGIPSQLLENRPDIRQAEQQLTAAKLNVKVAKAEFYPSLGIRGGIGYQAFNVKYLLQTPQSLIYSVAGDLAAPLINRNAIKANYYSANFKQIQAMYNYERSILNAYIEVANQLSNLNNLKSSFELKQKQVEALTQSIDISTILFKSARADYMEVLMTQRDALESKFELVETKMLQMHSKVNIYKALGGGWK